MWAVGLMLAEMVTGRTMVQRLQGNTRPVCIDTEFLQGVLREVATKVGMDSLLFQVYVCLIFQDPKDRLNALGLHEWLRMGTKPEFVTLNVGTIIELAELLPEQREADVVVIPPGPPVATSGDENSGDTVLAVLTQFAEAIAKHL
jgi:hypothetical protein